MIALIITTFLFALSLCADCFAVSVCSSVTLKKIELKNVTLIAFVFGIMQSGLMMVGYGFGDLFVGYVERIADWIGFLLLLYVGSNMIREAFEKDCEARDLNGFRNIIVAAVATSIDALAVGISLSMAKEPLQSVLWKWLAVFVVTIASVMVGMFCGQKIGHRFGKIAEGIGGLVLILIGLNILLDIV